MCYYRDAIAALMRAPTSENVARKSMTVDVSGCVCVMFPTEKAVSNVSLVCRRVDPAKGVAL